MSVITLYDVWTCIALLRHSFLALVINSVQASTVLAVYNSLSTLDKACAPRAHCAASALYFTHFGASSMELVA